MKNKTKKDFYNYNYWREVQRNQLTISSNVYFTFSASIVAYTLNTIITTSLKTNTCLKLLFIISILFHLVSLFFYVRLTDNKLKDYKKTATLINQGKTPEEVRNLTCELGTRTWAFYKMQKTFLFIGFVFSSIAFIVLIFK